MHANQQTHVRQTLPSVAARRSGFTLTELLVVISIVVILAGIMVPLVQPMLAGRDIREAARQLTVFIASAQARAVATGRPTGIWIERLGHLTDTSAQLTAGTPLSPLGHVSARLYLAETPPPYSGDFADAQVVIDNIDTTYVDPRTGQRSWLAHATFDLPGTSVGAVQLVRPGDRVQFGHRGHIYDLVDLDMTGTVPVGFFFRPTLEMTIDPLPLSPPRGVGLPMSFQIFRQPRKVSTSPLELPNKVVLDLSVSGMGIFGTDFFRNTAVLHDEDVDPTDEAAIEAEIFEHDVVVMFSPTGRLDHIYYSHHDAGQSFMHEGKRSHTVSLLATDDVYLLLGSIDKVERSGAGNLADRNNIWIAISQQTGEVQSAQNAGLPPGMVVASQPPFSAVLMSSPQNIAFARQLITTGQSLEGR